MKIVYSYYVMEKSSDRIHALIDKLKINTAYIVELLEQLNEIDNIVKTISRISVTQF